jgi:hypothetical protein
MTKEYAHLELLVEALVAGGNGVETPFSPSQGGMWCLMSQPLDESLCTRAAIDNPSITFDRVDDSLFCKHCWAVVYGSRHRFPNP